jgi:Holliday junction resolvase RusA-like endonuclease
MITFELPIYWTQTYKTKPDKVTLVGMNAYRNWHYQVQNNVKKEFRELVCEQLGDVVVEGQYKVDMKVYYKNVNCDVSNIVALIEKFSLDALQEHGAVVNDNVKYHLGTTWEVAGQDKTNPRCIVTIHEV